MAIDKTLRLVIVTPERTIFDEAVAQMRFPLYDGDIGIMPGRLPLIGRLGAGELKVTLLSGEERRFFIDGGFTQVNQGTVTLLTQRAVPVDQISAAAAEAELQAAKAQDAKSDEEFARKAAALNRARKLLKLARTH
ncbi:MAG TPA: ATP synthase F1 subunit epsilon [Planctomycetaceae bacterium]|nr:ATP synthase F1 subunit epsilon [Planctomycetaceae bacterium]